MFTSAQSPSRRDASSSNPNQDSDSASITHTEHLRKRPRSDNDVPRNVACNQCRLRKVRCDRRQPECSNCRKAGVECCTSNTIKRVNYTKQLRDEFSVVLEHLDHVDQALGTLTELTREIAARPCYHAIPPNSTYPPDSNTIPLPGSGLVGLARPSIQNDLQVLNNSSLVDEPLSETIQFDRGGERLYSYPAPFVLIKSTLHEAASPLLEFHQHGECHNDRETYITRALQDPTTRDTLQKKLDEFPFTSPCLESAVAGDADPVTTPPRLMVNLFVDGYLRYINTRAPIFDDIELHRAIDSHYSDSQTQESSTWALILNNIVLLELGLEIQTARASHSNSRGMNDDILPLFLKNCDRAINKIDAFMMPTIVNVQALMTLTLVARQFYNNATAERVCYAACQVGRAIGIHRSTTRRQNEGSNDPHDSAKERERLFRVLYAMDKQRVFMTGQPCDLHMFDSGHQICSDENYPLSNAFGHLMTIWEEIYLNLYTTRAANADRETRTRQIQLVADSMDRFVRKYSRLTSILSTNDIADIDPLQIELVYGYCVSQVLVLRCDRDNEQTRDKMRNFARSCLELLVKVCKAPLTPARLALLFSMFRNYPMSPFIELTNFRLASLFRDGTYNSAAQADVSLLRAVCDQLQILQHNNLPYAFYARLKLGLGWAIDTLGALCETLARPLSQPQGVVEFSPQSRQSRDSFQSTEVSGNSDIPGSIVPDISYACALRPNQNTQGVSNITSLRGEGGYAEQANVGSFTPCAHLIDPASRPILSTTCQSGSPSVSQPQSEFGYAPSSSNVNWDDFNIDFHQPFT